MQVYKSQFLEIILDQSSSVITFIWKEETKNAADEDFKFWNSVIVEKIERYKPAGVLSDNFNYLFTISEELQKWSVENIFIPMVEAGLKKLAMLVSLEMFPQKSLKEFTNKNESINTKYFSDNNLAIQWLMAG